MTAPVKMANLRRAAAEVSRNATDDELTRWLAQTPAATPFHSPAWGRAISAATGHAWHPLVVRDAAGSIIGLLPLHHIRSRLFGSALASAGFAVGGGILAADQDVADALASAAQRLAAELGAPSVELRGGMLPTGWHQSTATHLGFVRSLAADDEAELLAIPRKHRAEVRKGLANDLTVTVGTGTADRAAHYHCYATSVRNLGTPVFPRKLFDAVLDAFGDDADILTVRHDGKPVASVLSLYWQDAVMPYWGGGTATARNLRANERMYYALMRHAHARRCDRFDFGRSKVGSGPAAYKKNWGFAGEPLAYASWSVDGGAPRDMNPTSGKYALMVRTWQRLPLWLANRLGPPIARQLG